MSFDRVKTLKALEDGGLVAVIRADDAAQTVDICRALKAGGVTSWEIAMTTPGGLKAIELVRSELGGEGLVGVGTVLDAETAVAAAHAGAAFIFSPIVERGVIEAAHRYGRVAVPGALTPTEIAAAWSAGADMVKVFPANLFGPGYFKDLRGPLPQVKLTPTGGVTLETVPAWIKAGAAALGVGSSLVNMELARAGKWSELTQLAAKFVAAVKAARG